MNEHKLTELFNVDGNRIGHGIFLNEIEEIAGENLQEINNSENHIESLKSEIQSLEEKVNDVEGTANVYLLAINENEKLKRKLNQIKELSDTLDCNSVNNFHDELDKLLKEV